MGSVLGAGPRRARNADIFLDHKAEIDRAHKEQDQEGHTKGEFDSGVPIPIAED